MAYAIIYMLLGVFHLGLGVVKGGYVTPVVWVGANFFVVGLGHAGLGGRIYGKMAAGRLRWWSKIFYLPLLSFKWAVGRLRGLISSEQAYNRVGEDVFIGRRLLGKEIIKDMDNWVDLTAEFGEPKEMVQGMNYICLPILDRGTPTVEDYEQALRKVKTGRTYIHGARGHGRTGLFALGLLFERGVIEDYHEGIELLRKSRPAVKLNRKQREFIRSYFKKKQKVAHREEGTSRAG